VSAEEALPRPLVDELIDRLRRAILTGEIPAGTRINVNSLAERYGVSPIPIREAIRRLEAEALVDVEPRRGARAAAVSLHELSELYDLRRLIEVNVVRRAVPRHTGESLTLVAKHAAVLEGLDGAPRDVFEVAHKRFHWSLLEPGASHEIERVLSGIWQRTERYIRLAMTAFRTGPVGQAHHHRLLELCSAGEPDGVASCLEEHLNLTEAAIRTSMIEQADERLFEGRRGIESGLR